MCILQRGQLRRHAVFLRSCYKEDVLCKLLCPGLPLGDEDVVRLLRWISGLQALTRRAPGHTSHASNRDNQPAAFDSGNQPPGNPNPALQLPHLLHGDHVVVIVANKRVDWTLLEVDEARRRCNEREDQTAVCEKVLQHILIAFGTQ